MFRKSYQIGQYTIQILIAPLGLRECKMVYDLGGYEDYQRLNSQYNTLMYRT